MDTEIKVSNIEYPKLSELFAEFFAIINILMIVGAIGMFNAEN